MRDYFRILQGKLAKGGAFVVQFLEERYDNVTEQDAEMRVYEPSISWNIMQLADLARDSGLTFGEVRTQQLAEKTFWHWVYFKNEITN